MPKKVLYIKNMVCDRCIMAVKQSLSEMKIPFSEVQLGVAKIERKDINYDELNDKLKKIGFELIKDTNNILIEQIKTLIINFIHYNDGENLKINFSEYIHLETGYDYTYLSKLFSEKESLTIEKYIILQKIERVKELISYGEHNFSEIAYLLNYSSVSHLSRQFKKIEGITLSDYKKAHQQSRKTLDKI